MVRRNRFIKWQTPARNAKSSYEGANPTPPSPMQRRRPPARTTIESKRTVGHHFFETMCPTAFLAPTLIAKTCFICTQPKHAFFLAQLALQGHRANGKKPLPGRVPGPKKGTKMVPKSGSFQKNSSAQWPKKSPKNWTGPCLSLNMVRRNRFIKWQTPARNAKSSYEGANPTPPSPMQRRRPPARTTIESKRTVGGLASEGDKTVIPGPKYWNPISSSKCIVLARQD